MVRRLPKLITILTLVVGVLIGLIWAALALPVFNPLRQQLAQQILSDIAEQPITINGEVSARLGRQTLIVVRDLTMGSSTLPDETLAELKSLQYDINLAALTRGQIDVNNVELQGFSINLLTTEDGTKSWHADRRRQNQTSTDPDPDNRPFQAILTTLRTRTAEIEDIAITVRNQQTGFDFDMRLDDLQMIQQDGGGTLSLTSNGSVNDQPFDISGTFPEGAPFASRLTFGGADLSFDGEPGTANGDDGFVGTITLDVGDLSEALDILRLKSALNGSGQAKVDISATPGRLDVTDLAIALDMANGNRFDVTGTVSDFGPESETDILATARLYPEGQIPRPARELADLEITDISTRILGDGLAFRFEDLLITSNWIVQDLQNVGPVSVGRIRRTEEGTLALDDVSITAGPEDTPILQAEGSIQDALAFKGLDVDGALTAPAELLLWRLGQDVAEAFGTVAAGFTMTDAPGFLSLTHLTLETRDTDIWSLSGDITVEDVTSLDGLDMNLSVATADAGELLAALKLDPVSSGPLEFEMGINVDGDAFGTRLALETGTSDLSMAFQGDVDSTPPTINGQITSQVLALADLRQAVKGISELGKLTSNKTELQPLVLPPEEDPIDLNPIPLQPLVLPVEERTTAEFLNIDDAMEDVLLTTEIAFERIEGIQGVTSLKTTLVSDQGKAQLGPLRWNYGNGFIQFEVLSDLVSGPETLNIRGSTGGWDFGNILSELGLDIPARGQLRGNFNLTGSRASTQAFTDTLRGSATVSMDDAQIATSLLELAGLGIFPWLFSTERRQGYTDIVCLRAPISLNSGRVSFEAVVLETLSVQLITRGFVDVPRKVLSVRAQPRPVGRPLARSAWPFVISGSLASPDVKVDRSGRRLRRTDGAETMPDARTPCTADILQLE